MSVPARMSFVTLGAGDVESLRAFYERLGWQVANASVEGEVAFFWLGGAVLALYDRASLLHEIGLPPEVGAASPEVRDVSIAINVERPEEVAAILAEAERAEGRVLAEARTMSWGGVSGYFADPEGHAWEVAYNPFMPLDDEGRLLPLET